jgi:hypothetical protein
LTCKNATAPDKRRHQEFHLLLIGVPGDTSVAQFDRKIGSSNAFQDDPFIDDRAVSLKPMKRIGKRRRCSGSVVKQSHLAKVSLASQSKTKHRILQGIGGKFKERDLACNSDPEVFVVYVIERQPGMPEQRFEGDFCLTQSSRG